MAGNSWGLRRLAVAVGVAALSVVGVAGAAQAADGGNIDPDTPTSLTIHKYDGVPGAAGNGTKIENPTGLGNPLVGVTFDIIPVTAKNNVSIDLTTAAGWDLIAGATVADVTSPPYTFGTPVPVVTGNDGSVTQSLPKGLYLVKETGPGANNIISPVQPFLVTLPLPQGNGGWLYDVHVYPKNKINTTTPTKVVADPSAPVLNSTVAWTINAPVPALATGDTYTSFVITDQLDPRLQYQSATVTGFTTSTDYTATESGRLVTITFTPAGVAKLTSGQVVVATITTKVVSVGDGVIKNKAAVNTNGSSVTTDEPTTNWGALKVLKYAGTDQSNTLAGAEFDVYSDAAATTKVGTLTTNASGTSQISLWVGNNGTTQKDYWVKETKAPAGYVLDTTLRQVTVKAGTEAAAVTLTVANTQQGHPTLPLTGANGQMIAAAGGVAMMLLAAGVAFVVAQRRRSHQN